MYRKHVYWVCVMFVINILIITTALNDILHNPADIVPTTVNIREYPAIKKDHHHHHRRRQRFQQQNVGGDDDDDDGGGEGEWMEYPREAKWYKKHGEEGNEDAGDTCAPNCGEEGLGWGDGNRRIWVPWPHQSQPNGHQTPYDFYPLWHPYFMGGAFGGYYGHQ